MVYKAAWYCRACGKKAFPSERAADRAIELIQSSGHVRRGGPRRHYPCPHGHGHHLTSMKESPFEQH